MGGGDGEYGFLLLARLFFIQVVYYTPERLYSFLSSATVVNTRDLIVVDSDHAFALVDFVASKVFSFDLFLLLWKT